MWVLYTTALGNATLKQVFIILPQPVALFETLITCVDQIEVLGPIQSNLFNGMWGFALFKSTTMSTCKYNTCTVVDFNIVSLAELEH